MKLEYYIASLLYHQDCVVVPGFGGFIGNPSPAGIRSDRHTFYPPRKTILFNFHLRQNDGLLAYAVATGEQVSYGDALLRIAATVQEWEGLLDRLQRIELDKIGVLYRDATGILQFEQNLSVNYLSSAFGLELVIAPHVRREVPGLPAQSDVVPEINRPVKVMNIPKPLKWAAILALPIGISALLGIQNFDRIRDFSASYSGWFSSRLDPFHSSKYSPVPAVKTPAKLYRMPVVAKTSSPTAGGALTSPEPLPVKEEVPIETTVSVTASHDRQFAIIVGAFRLRVNADNLVAGLREKGFDAAIEDTTRMGLFRVRIQAFREKNEALAQLAIIRSESYPGAWLLQK